jgi:hypothetical protein
METLEHVLLLINVSAPLFAHPGPTKTKPGSPRANHAPVALTKTKPGSPRAKNALLANTKTKTTNQVAKTIAMWDPILTPSKVNV